jgi:mannose-6-phosphate isomerase-like protein (cupin superfamily)
MAEERKQVREFMTGWFGDGPMSMETWSVRDKAGLMGTATSKRAVPAFRPFDMIAAPNGSVLVFENSDQRLGVESVCGAQPAFRRNLDFQTVYFQFAGNTTLETEYGIVEMQPGDLTLIPEGIAHRGTGTADSLRWYFHLREPVQHMFTAEKQSSRTQYEVIRRGGPDWKIPAGAAQPSKGRVVEHMVQWRDPSADYYTTIERDYASLVDVSSKRRDTKVSGITHIAAFDCFTEVTGRHGPGPKLLQTKYFVIEAYNTVGEQFAFHRGLLSEEFGIQFAGKAINMTELEARQQTDPGDCALVPLGISHAVLCEPGFLRMVPYSRIPWDVRVDPAKHAFHSTFETKVKVVEPHAWHKQMADELAQAH